MPVASLLYAGILGVISIAVAFPAGRLRGQLGVAIGDGGNRDLLLAMRRHANFVEYVPIALILLVLLELNGVSKIAIHSLGAALVLARICHAFGIKAENIKSAGRAIGAAVSALVTLVASVWAIVIFV
jgi:uncharacterized membrane protein YecN with MAPEG domain